MALKNASSDVSQYSYSSSSAESKYSVSTDSLYSIRTNKEKYNNYSSAKKNRSCNIGSKLTNLENPKVFQKEIGSRNSTNNCSALSIKSNNSKCSTNVQKQHVTSKPLPTTGYLAKNSDFSASELYFSFENSHTKHGIDEKNSENSENYPLSKAIASVKGQANDVIHIEVFLPVIDSTENITIYPKSRTPIIKCYSEKEYSLVKNKSYINANNANSQTGLEKPFVQKTKKDTTVTSNRKAKNSPRIRRESKNCKNNLNEREYLERDLNNVADIKDLPLIIATNETQKLSTDVKRTKSQQFVAEKPQLFCKKISSTLESVCNGNKEGINSKLSDSKYQNVNQNSLLSELVINYAERTGSGLNELVDRDSHHSKITGLKGTSKVISRKGENEKKNEHAVIEPSQKKSTDYKQVYLQNLPKKNTESASLTVKKLVKSKSEVNGWSRNISVKACTNRFCSSVNNWKRDLKHLENLSMESWLDRSKYLQSRKQNNDSYHQNNWSKR